MNTDMNMVKAEGKKSIFTTKKVLRMLALLCTAFVFFPMFFVSCSGQEVEVDVMTAMRGVSIYGDEVVKPYPIMLICLIIPVLLFILTKKIERKRYALILLGSMCTDFIMWISFKATVKRIANENYCTYRTTGWFYINIIVMALAILLISLVFIGKIRLDTDLLQLVTGNDKQEFLKQVNNTINKMTDTMKSNMGKIQKSENAGDERAGFCIKCGAGITAGSKFCTLCGAEVPMEILEEKEESSEDCCISENNQQVKVCKQCGAELMSDCSFCEQCGTKVE